MTVNNANPCVPPGYGTYDVICVDVDGTGEYGTANKELITQGVPRCVDPVRNNNHCGTPSLAILVKTRPAQYQG